MPGLEFDIREGSTAKKNMKMALKLDEAPGMIPYKMYILLGTNISPAKVHFEDDFPFPKVGYVNFLEGISFSFIQCRFQVTFP